jgi:hypothetical protein
MPNPLGMRISRQSGSVPSWLLPSSHGSSQIVTVSRATAEKTSAETFGSERLSAPISER